MTPISDLGRATPVPRSTRATILPLLLVASAALLFLVRGLLVPLLLGVLLAYALEPLAAPLVERGVRRRAAAAALFAILALAVLPILSWLSPVGTADAAEIARQLPELGARIEATAAATLGELHAAQPWSASLVPIPSEGWTARVVATQREHLGGLVGQAGALLFVALLVPIVAFFLLADGRRALERTIALLPAREIETSVAIWCEIYGTLGRYLRGVAIESAIVGLLATVGLTLLGVPSAAALGLVTALVNPVPYLGALVSVTIAVLVTLAYQLGLAKAVAVALLYFGLRLLDDFVIIPFTIGRSVHLHPFVVLLSILAGNELFGLVGMVIAVPAATIVQEVARIVLVRRPSAEVSDSPVVRAAIVC